MSEAIDTFDLAFAEYKFDLKNKQGVIEHYTMRELTGLARDQYLSEMSTRFDTDGKTTRVRNLVGVPEMLLGRCVYQVKDDGSEELVKGVVIAAWPSSIREKLHEKATKLSGLDKASETEVKND